MSNTRTSLGRLASLFACCALVSACGGGGGAANEAPSPAPTPSPAPAPAPAPAPDPDPGPAAALKVSGYTVYLRDDGLAFSGAGAVTPSAGSNDVAVSLGSRGETRFSVLSESPFSLSARSIDFRAAARFDGSLVMLCAPGATPGAGLSRYALVAQAVADGGVLPVQFTTVATLANRTLYAFAHCSYQAASGSQGQDSAHDAQTVALSFDAAGSAVRSGDAPGSGPYFTSDQLGLLLGGTPVNGRAVAAYRAMVGGVERVFLIERTFYDEIGATEGSLTIWLDE